MSSRHHYNTLRRTGPVHVGVDLLQAQQQTQQIKKLIKKIQELTVELSEHTSY